MIPKYLTLRDKIKADIISKKYPLYSKLPTEVELAKEYSVSRSTVRQALAYLVEEGIIDKRQGSGNIVIATGELDYIKTVAIMVSYSSGTYYGNLIGDIKSVLLKEGLSVQIFETENMISKERSCLEEILKNSYAGVIAEPAKSGLASPNTDLYKKLMLRQLPFVFIGSYIDSLRAPYVVANDYSAGYRLCRQLINQGHKRIGGIFKIDDLAGQQRYFGFVEALRDADIEILDNSICFFTSKEQTEMQMYQNYTFLKEFVSQSSGTISSLICNSDEVAFHIIELSHQYGLRVPSDLAVVGIGNEHSPSSISISTMALASSLGKEAALSLLSQKQGRRSDSVSISYKYIPGESC